MQVLYLKVELHLFLTSMAALEDLNCREVPGHLASTSLQVTGEGQESCVRCEVPGGRCKVAT